MASLVIMKPGGGEVLMFLKNGLLPAGDHEISLDQLERLIRQGPGGGGSWDTAWRLQLLEEFKQRYEQLAAVGITEVYIDGSYATDKYHPNDLDAYFVVPRQLWRTSAEAALKEFDPEFWRFETVSDPSGKRGYPMAFLRHIEMFPVYQEHTPAWADCLEMIDPKISFFRTDKWSNRPKGIIKITEVPV